MATFRLDVRYLIWYHYLMQTNNVAALTIALDNAIGAQGYRARNRELTKVEMMMQAARLPAAHALWEKLNDANARNFALVCP